VCVFVSIKKDDNDSVEVIEDDNGHISLASQVDLSFDGIQLDMTSRRTKSNGNGVRTILDGSLRGRARPGRMLAIMYVSITCIVGMCIYMTVPE
jgi:hypothetical protein